MSLGTYTARSVKTLQRIARLDRPWHKLPGIGLIVLAAAIVALLGGSSLQVVLAAALAAAALAAWSIRAGRLRQRLMSEFERDSETEIGGWIERWQLLQQEAQQTTSTLAMMRDGVILLSRASAIALINPAARRLLALSRDQDLCGRDFAEVVRQPDLARVVAAARAGDGAQEIVVEISDRQRVRPVRVRVDRFAAVADNNLLITLSDETEARRIDEMRKEFVANISHELKTPLAAIKGYAETVELAIKDDPDAAEHFMNQIRAQCLRMERLISDMMQLARAQAGGSQLKISSISWGEVINESLKSYRPVAETKNITLEVEPAAEARVRADPEAALTISNNLIGNAINYTPSGGHVRVSCRQEGRFWALVVEDTGVGIPEAEQKRIFERFYRVERNRSSMDGGTGIGLSIVKNLTMTLGGEVRVSSRPGEGSRFEVLLPREAPANGLP
jgi:two-component system phosphate regulon sensor histidine kinase PhoR